MYRLRELNKKDILTINKWRNDEKLISYLGAPFRYINEDVDDEWYNNYMKNRSNNIRCAIVDEEDKILGLVSILSINYVNQTGILNIMIGNSDNYNKGIGTFAIKKILNHAFMNLNLRRIELSVLESNSRAIHVYEKIGFEKEGIKKKAVYKNGTYINMLMYAILKENYKST